MIDWIICDTDFSSEQIADRGNKYLIGNGYVGVRGTLEEYGKDQFVALNLSAVYDKHGDGWREPLNAPNTLYTYLVVDGTVLALPSSVPFSHQQKLDYRHGIHSRITVWETAKGKVTLSSERFASMANYHRVGMEYTVSADYPCTMKIITGIDGDVWDINGPHYNMFTCEEEQDTFFMEAYAGEATVAVAESRRYFFHAKETNFREGNKMLCEIEFSAEKDKKYILQKETVIYTSNDCNQPLHTVKNPIERFDYNKEKLEHLQAWEALWQKSEIRIDGDDTAMEAINYSLYHLHCIAPRYAKSASIPARGLSGQTYKGAIFWDTEMFMLGFYLLTEPETAKKLLQYRIDTLPGALSKARQYGYQGAFYAWESQDGGFDACSDYNITDVFTGRPIRTYFKDKQVHISGAVAYAITKYTDYTHDSSLLLSGGLDVLIACAQFYYSLLLKPVGLDRYEIHDVIGPDEYHERVNNNAYTNRMAKFTFDAVLKACRTLCDTNPAVYTELSKKYNLDDLLKRFSNAASFLFIPKPDENTGVIPQFDGYFDLEDAEIAAVKSRLLDPKEYWGGAHGVASQTQVIKQADVVAMLCMFHDYDDAVKSKNLSYYEPRTEHGSSLSACMYGILSCQCHRSEQAYSYFLKSASADLKGGGKQWAGLVYIGGTHPAAAGGAWKTVIEGFAGISFSGGKIICRPNLPNSWKRLQFCLCFEGTYYDVEVTQDAFSIIKK